MLLITRSETSLLANSDAEIYFSHDLDSWYEEEETYQKFLGLFLHFLWKFYFGISPRVKCVFKWHCFILVHESNQACWKFCRTTRNCSPSFRIMGTETMGVSGVFLLLGFWVKLFLAMSFVLLGGAFQAHFSWSCDFTSFTNSSVFLPWEKSCCLSS